MDEETKELMKTAGIDENFSGVLDLNKLYGLEEDDSPARYWREELELEPEDVLRLQIQKTGAVVWTGYLANGRTFSGSTTLLHEDAALIRTPFAIAYAPAASVKAGKKTPAVNYPAFCDTVTFQYEMPEPGSPAERSK